MTPVYQATEAQRLAVLEEYGLSPDIMQAELEPLNRLATALFDVPTSMVSVVAQTQTMFASRTGIDVCEVDRDISFCTHVLNRDEPLILLDASLDPRFSSNPLVTGPAHVRFYAGAPLRGPSGHVIGSFCLLDTRPRNNFSDKDRANLKLLAGLALDRFELRRLERARVAGQTRFEQISATSPTGIICADHNGLIRFWNKGAETMFGYSAAEAEGQSIELIVPKHMHGGHGGGLKRVAAGGKPTLVGKNVELPARRRDGSEFPIDLALSMWTENGNASFGAIIRDLTQRKADEERLYRLAHFDHLTELPNRAVLKRRLGEVIAAKAPAALLFADLDGFKQVNDTLGHSAGDKLLQEVAARMLKAVRPTDMVTRMGGDEFAILLPDSGDYLTASTRADAIMAALSQPFLIEDEAFHLSASIGIALSPHHGGDVDELLSAADLALYEAKDGGRHCKKLFSSPMREAAIVKRLLDAELRLAVEHQQFELFYQPQVDAVSGALTGAEALIRWRHPERGLLSPAAFLPALESSPLAMKVGRWILNTACKQAALWQRHHLDFRMGVNLFGVQLRAGNLVMDVRDALARTGLPAQALELEVTENIVLGDDETALQALRQLRDNGVQIAFDDYGTGFASLSQLKRCPITRLKVDQSFVRNLSVSKQDAGIIRAIVQLAQSFSLQVIAEGVETEVQRARLVAKGIEELQGYLFGRPMPAGDFARTFGFAGSRATAA